MRHAARLADANEATLHVLHVVSREEASDLALLVPDQQAVVTDHLNADAENRLTDELSALGSARPACVHIASGSVIHEILAAVTRLDVDLLAVGVNGSSQSSGLGTIAVRCARKAPTKVLLVPEHAAEKFTSVVACVDFSELTHGVLEQAMRVARLDGAPVTALHVYQQPWTRTRWVKIPENMSELDVKLRALLSARLQEHLGKHVVERDGLDVRQELVQHPDYGDGIVAFARDASAELIVLGTTGRSTLAYMLLGTTAEKVLRGAGCTVLAVKPPGTRSRLAGEIEAQTV